MGTAVDSLSVEIGVLAGKLQSFVLNKAVDAELRSPMELDEDSFSLCVHEGESIDSKALHHPVRTRDSTVL